MDRIISVGLKEWAVVVEAVLDGRQSLLIREGALREVRQEFQVAHGEFLLYPTYEELLSEYVVEAWRDRLKRIQSRRPDPSEVIVKGYATVEAIWELGDRDKLRAAATHTIWSIDYLERRFRDDTPICALMVRTFRLLMAREIYARGRYPGSKTWIELADGINLENSRPAITDESFKQQAAELHQELG